MSSAETRTDKQLRKAKNDAAKTLKRLATVDAAKAWRDGSAARLLLEGETARATFEEARLELQRRRSQTTLAAIAKDHDTRAGLTLEPFQRLSIRLGLALNPNRLTASERKELLQLSRGDDRVRFEALAEKAGSAPGFFEERRQVQAAKAKLGELAREGREAASLDVRVPGRVFRWLDDGAPEAPHGLFEIAILAAVGDALENGRLPGRGASFEGDTLVLPEGFEFAGCEWPNDGLRAGASIGRLAANGLLRLSKDAGMLRVTLPKD